YKVPEWAGQELAGKRIFFYGEQGFGDTIQFARFSRSVGRQGATVILEVSAPLAGLLQRLDCQPVVVRQGEEVPDFDFHLPLMSVPFIVGWAPEQNGPEPPYLSADPTRIDRWSHRLCSDEFKVGIAWQGNPAALVDKGRSIPLTAFAPLSRIPG